MTSVARSGALGRGPDPLAHLTQVDRLAALGETTRRARVLAESLARLCLVRPFPDADRQARLTELRQAPWRAGKSCCGARPRNGESARESRRRRLALLSAVRWPGFRRQIEELGDGGVA
jgi:hypothetical protein